MPWTTSPACSAKPSASSRSCRPSPGCCSASAIHCAWWTWPRCRRLIPATRSPTVRVALVHAGAGAGTSNQHGAADAWPRSSLLQSLRLVLANPAMEQALSLRDTSRLDGSRLSQICRIVEAAAGRSAVARFSGMSQTALQRLHAAANSGAAEGDDAAAGGDGGRRGGRDDADRSAQPRRPPAHGVGRLGRAAHAWPSRPIVSRGPELPDRGKVRCRAAADFSS